MTHFFGAHTVDNGGIHMAARRAGAAGMKALQLFTTIPKYYGDKSSIKPERVTRFRGALAEAAIDPRFVMAHSAYVLNTATAEEEKYSRAKAGLAKELERSSALGIGQLCFHPGAGQFFKGRKATFNRRRGWGNLTPHFVAIGFNGEADSDA